MPEDENDPSLLELPAPNFTDTNKFEIVRAPRVVADPGTDALAPQTASEFAGTGRGAKSFGIVPSFEERNVSPGTPLDVESGVSTWDRLQLARRSAERDQFSYLQNKYGDKIRKSDTGEWIIRVPDESTGQEKDIVANPHKMTLGDFGSLLGHAPEVAAWVAGEKGLRAIPALGKMKGVGGLMRDVVGGAAGAETFGGLQDIETRSLEDRTPLDLGEILGRRAGGFVGDVAVGTPLAAGARFLNWVRSPFSGLSTDIQFDAVAAQKAFEAERGILVPINLGEISGNPDIIRRAKYLGKVPGGAEAMAGFEQRQKTALQKLQDILIGTDFADELRLGKQVMGAAETKLAPAVAEEAAAKKEVQTTGTSDLESLISDATAVGTPSNPTMVGDAIRTKLVGLRDAAKAEADKLYGVFKGITGDQPNISGVELAKAAEKIKKDAASAFKTKPSPVVTPAGTPAGSTVVQEPSKAFVPETSVMRRLDELIDNKGAMYRFSDLQKMRAEIADDLAKSEGVPGLGAHYLSRISSALTDSMEKGVASMANPSAKSALEAANKYYRENVVPFSKKGINEIFRNEFEPGYIGPSQLADSFTSGAAATDRYNLIKSFLGSGTPEMKVLNRHIADSALKQGQLLGSETLDAKTFLRNLSRFVNDQPEIAGEVLGSKQAKMVDTAKTMILADENALLPADEVAKLVASGKADTRALQRLMRAQSDLTAKTQNSVLDAIKRKSVTGLDVSAEDLVNRWLPKASREEISQFMSMLADRPALVDDMRSLYAQKLFAKAAESGGSVSDALAKAYGEEKGRLLLGDKLMQDLQKYGALQKAIGFARKTAEGAGGMAAGKRLDEIITQPLTQLPKAFREWVTAKILTSDTMRNWALAGKPGEPGNLMLVLSSPPFIKSVADTFGTGSTAQNFMQTLHQGLGDWFKSNMAQQKSDTQQRRQFEVTKPKSIELPKPMFGAKGGSGFVTSTNQPPAIPKRF